MLCSLWFPLRTLDGQGILIEQGSRASKMPSYDSHPGLSGTQTRHCATAGHW